MKNWLHPQTSTLCVNFGFYGDREDPSRIFRLRIKLWKRSARSIEKLCCIFCFSFETVKDCEQAVRSLMF